MSMRKLSSLLMGASIALWAASPAHAFLSHSEYNLNAHHGEFHWFHNFSHAVHFPRFEHLSGSFHFPHFEHFAHFEHFPHFEHFAHFEHFQHFPHFEHFAHFEHFQHFHHFATATPHPGQGFFHPAYGGGHLGGPWPALAVAGVASVALNAGIVWNSQCRELSSDEAMTSLFLPVVGIAFDDDNNKCRR
ncbi:MAG: hypothetical protein ACLPGW_15570 [Roseiarcus sp.]